MRRAYGRLLAGLSIVALLVGALSGSYGIALFVFGSHEINGLSLWSFIKSAPFIGCGVILGYLGWWGRGVAQLWIDGRDHADPPPRQWM